MNLKEELVQISNKEIGSAASSLAKVIKPKLIKSAKNGYLALKINLENPPDYAEDCLKYAGEEKFRAELSCELDGISVYYEQKSKYIEAFGVKRLVGNTPYLIFNWANEED